jgi:hypothetical protein
MQKTEKKNRRQARLLEKKDRRQAKRKKDKKKDKYNKTRSIYRREAACARWQLLAAAGSC